MPAPLASRVEIKKYANHRLPTMKPDEVTDWQLTDSNALALKDVVRFLHKDKSHSKRWMVKILKDSIKVWRYQ